MGGITGQREAEQVIEEIPAAAKEILGAGALNLGSLGAVDLGAFVTFEVIRRIGALDRHGGADKSAVSPGSE